MQRTVAEFKAYIIGQNLPPAIKNLQRVDDMLPQVKYRFKRAEQLKVEFGLLSKEDIILKPPPANEEEVRKEFAEVARLSREYVMLALD